MRVRDEAGSWGGGGMGVEARVGWEQVDLERKKKKERTAPFSKPEKIRKGRSDAIQGEVVL